MKKDYIKPSMNVNGQSVKVLKANNNLRLKNMMGIDILIPVGEAAERIEGGIRLSESGCFLWRFLQNKRTQEELVEAIVREYNVDLKTAAEDVEEFVQQMERLGVLEER